MLAQASRARRLKLIAVVPDHPAVRERSPSHHTVSGFGHRGAETRQILDLQA
jgi:hypothetical protein